MPNRYPIVIFPGHLCNARLFAPQTGVLGKAADIQIADLYGQDNVVDLAANALLSAPPQFVLIANSMGGAVAFEALRQSPQRIQALVLIGTTCRAEIPTQSERRVRAVELTEQEDWAGLARLYAPVFFDERNRAREPVLAETLERMIVEVGKQGIKRQQRAFSSRPDSRATLATIRCPTLVICGREDTITPLALSEETASLVQGAELAVIEQCGHVPTLERPVQTTKTIRRWLDSLEHVTKS